MPPHLLPTVPITDSHLQSELSAMSLWALLPPVDTAVGFDAGAYGTHSMQRTKVILV